MERTIKCDIPCQNYLLFALGRGQLFVGREKGKWKTGNLADQPFQRGTQNVVAYFLAQSGPKRQKGSNKA